MTIKTLKHTLLATIAGSALLLGAHSCTAADLSLPAPEIADGLSVMQALQQRQSTRSYAGQAISPAQLSQLLWAANGINRPDNGGRTVPAGLKIYSVDVYAVTAGGIYLYNPQTHALEEIAQGDYRRTTTRGQEFAATAPLTLVYVSTPERWSNAPFNPPEGARATMDAITAGAMTQSVSLAAAANGLGTCVRGSVDKEAFAEAAGLQNKTIIAAQSIGVLQ